MLTQEKLKSMLRYDETTGVFTWIVKPNRRISAGSIASNSRRDGYVRIGIDGGRYLAHRLAWLYIHGRWPDGVLDHINGNPSDNKIANLRECTQTENQLNRRICANNKAGRKGVLWDKAKKKWLARAQLHKKTYHLGYFNDIESADAAYQRFATTHHGEFACSQGKT